MKLVFLSHDGKYNGGAQKCLVDLLRGLKKKYPDIQLYVIFPYEGDLIKACLPFIEGYKVISLSWWLISGSKRMGIKQKIKFLKRMIRPIRQVLYYLLKIKPDYGITNTIVIPHLAVSCKLLGIKHDWFIHEIPSDTWNDNVFVFTNVTILRWINFLSRKIFVTSEFAKSYYKKSIKSAKIKVLDQAVEMDVPISLSVSSHQRYTILLVGAFDSNKGQMELLQAVNQIISSGRDIYCYLVGDDLGNMMQCKEYVALHKLENNVSIVSFVKDIWKYYYWADVLVVCSFLETFGRVTVEAQKCGLPVILSNVGANPERLLNNVNGLLYQKNNLIDLVSKIEYLRSNETRKIFAENITLLNLDKYSATQFASHFVDEL